MKFIIIILMFFVSCTHASATYSGKPAEGRKTNYDTLAIAKENMKGKTSAVYFKIVPSENHTFGYHIYEHQKLLVRQLSVPGLAGNEGFKTKLDAEKVANLVLSKIEKGEFPPLVSKKELEKLRLKTSIK